MRVPVLAIVTVAAVLLGTGCSGPEDQALAACTREIENKVGSTEFVIDRSSASLKTTREADDIVRVQAGITFDPGLPKESRQTFDCRVRIGEDGASVIALQFIW